MKEPPIRSLLRHDGALSRLLPGYTERPQQADMALDIWRTIETRSALLAEAGTGTGKTCAYLLPAMLSDARVIVSTGTKTLQDQLFYKDIPVVREATASDRRAALLKGRANYLCPYRLYKHLDSLGAGVGAHIQAQLQRLREWYPESRTGDITEVLDMEAEANLLPLITSNADNCLGGECPRIGECPVYRARGRALEADIVVVNHHLLFADMALQDDDLASVLPTAGVVVIDEAHQVPDVARQFFGMRVSSGQFTELCRDTRVELALLGNDDAHLAQCTTGLERSVGALYATLRELAGIDLDLLLASAETRDRIEQVDMALGDMRQALDAASVRSRALANCHQRASRLADRFALLTESTDLDEEYAHWLQVQDRRFSMHLTPVSIARHFGARVAESGQAWIFTSATLTVGGAFDHVKNALGLEAVCERCYASPFDFMRQVRAWLPAALPRPGDDEHTEALVAMCLPVIERVRGRTFFLFTSYRALRVAAASLARAGVACIAQGEMSRVKLLERFRATERCVLLATYSFWEGVDVRGADLHCLIIDKLPFASPEDPLTRASMRAIDAAGGNGFMEYLIPDAAITLRQGFGRLVRDDADRGLFVLGDPRVASRPYGRLFISSLPEMEWLAEQAHAIDFVEALQVQ